MLQQEEEERARLLELTKRQAVEDLEKQTRMEEDRIRTEEQEKVSGGTTRVYCCV